MVLIVSAHILAPKLWKWKKKSMQDSAIFQEQAGKLVLARSPMQVKIWLGEWKTGLGEWNFV